ncbi:MAG: preprotein translocase subunit YajC [Saprospiraceae bacterium]
MTNVAFIFLQTGADPASLLANFGPLILIFLVFWYFFIRPQGQKQKEQETFSNEIEKGDEVVTSSGILGKINKIEGNIVTLEVGNKTYIRFTRNAISKELTDAVAASMTEKAEDDKE